MIFSAEENLEDTELIEMLTQSNAVAFHYGKCA